MTDLATDFTRIYGHWLDQPLEVSVETFAKCNAACTFCPYPTMDRIGDRMSDDLINRLIGEMAEFKLPFYFSPFKVNEPFLDKRVLPMLRQLEERTDKSHLRLFTNGSTLTDQTVDDIAALRRVEHLWISLNEYREAEYEKLMGLKWKQVTANIDRLHAREDFPHPVILSTVGRPNNEFRLYCLARWPKFASTALHQDAWIDFTDSQKDTVPDVPCGRWWELSIMANGVVSHCCMHSGEDATYNIGDVNKQTMLEVYNSPFWRERREKLFSRRVLDARSPCSRCTY